MCMHVSVCALVGGGGGGIALGVQEKTWRTKRDKIILEAPLSEKSWGRRKKEEKKEIKKEGRKERTDAS